MTPRPARSFAVRAAAVLAVVGVIAAGFEHKPAAAAQPVKPHSAISPDDWEPDTFLTNTLLDIQAATVGTDPREPYVHLN